jgi:hypothetical protein
MVYAFLLNSLIDFISTYINLISKIRGSLVNSKKR